MRQNWFGPLLQKRLVITLLILVQLFFLIGLIVSGSRYFITLHWLLTAVNLYAALGMMTRRMKSAYKLTWMFLMLLFPLFGGLFYLFFTYQASTISFRKCLRKIHATTRGYFRLIPPARRAEANASSGLARYLDACCGFPPFDATDVQYFPSGEKLHESLLEALTRAKQYIFLEFFIIQEGKMWDSILKILEEKAKQGVDVRLIYDDFGCFFLLPKNYREILKEKGIACAVFNPFRPFLSAGQNHRDHRKIAVIDGKSAFTGGANLADEYINEIEKHGHWKDTAVKLSGPAAWSFTVMFLQQWAVCTGTAEDFEQFCPWKDVSATSPHKGLVQPFSDSPMDAEDVYEAVYLSMIHQAKNYVYLTTPYLISDDNMISALCLAAKRGVAVEIITPHIWDKRFVHSTTRSYYRELLDAGVKIFEYTDGFIHSKTCVSDDSSAVVGTANLDFRSLYLQFECGVLLTESEAVFDIRDDFLRTRAVSGEITPEECACSKWTAFIQKVLRLFAPLM